MDTFSKQKRSKIMTAIRSKHTTPELAVRKALRAKGTAYRLHYGKEKIDIAIPQKKVAIFVDGCFWHQCPYHSHLPKSNRGYWLPKLRKNKERAKKKDERLRAAGWKIVHIWEHDTAEQGKVVQKVGKLLLAKPQQS